MYEIHLINSNFHFSEKIKFEQFEPIHIFKSNSEIESNSKFETLERNLKEGFSIVLFYDEKNLNQTSSLISSRSDFEEYILNERKSFVTSLRKVYIENEIRTKAESFVQAYDQLFVEVRKLNI